MIKYDYFGLAKTDLVISNILKSTCRWIFEFIIDALIFKKTLILLWHCEFVEQQMSVLIVVDHMTYDVLFWLIFLAHFLSLKQTSFLASFGEKSETRLTSLRRLLFCEIICISKYFSGGGKCGSTSLALLLKHNISSLENFDPSSGFANGGKEPCWALASGGEKELYHKFQTCSTLCNPSKQPKTVVLDACPRYSKVCWKNECW